MTPKTFITIVLAGAVLTLGAQTALAGTTPAAMHEDGFDRAVAAQTALWMAEDGFDRAVAAKLALQSSPPAAVSAPAPVSAPSSSTQIAWLQIGIGFGIGILSVLALILGVRLTRNRTLVQG